MFILSLPEITLKNGPIINKERESKKLVMGAINKRSNNSIFLLLLKIDKVFLINIILSFMVL